jgi:hypothetical protein
MPGGKRRYWIAVILLLVLAGCACLLFLNATRESSLSHRLPDGTVVTVRQVSYGRVYRDVPTNGWKRLAGRILPEKYSAKLGIKVFPFTNATESTIIFLDTVGTNLNGVPGFWGYTPFPNATNMHSMYDVLSLELFGASIQLEDDAGNGFLLSKEQGSTRMGAPFRQFFRVPLASHAANFFTLTVNQYDAVTHTNFSSTFVVRNPAPHRKTQWTAQPFPLTNRVDDLTVELLAIEPGSPHEFVLYGRLGRINHGTRARLRVLQDGVPTSAWRVTGVTVADEEGSVFVPRALDFPDAGTIGFDGGLSPREIRKFRFELNRAPPFRKDEKSAWATISIASLPAFDYGQSSLGLDNGEYKLQIRRMYREKIDGAYELWFNYDLSPQPPADVTAQIFVQAVDQDGREVTFVRSGAPVDLRIGFKIPASVKSDTVKITFALTKPRYVEFLARPSPVSTNSLSSAK